MEDSPPISIVVPLKNRKNMIPRLIISLLNLDYPTYEIIIVDDASTDGSSELLKAFDITHVRLDHSVGSARARNIGIERATHQIIALTDSDCVVSQTWLKELVPYLGESDLIGGFVQYHDYAEHRITPTSSIPSEVEIALKSDINFINTANILFRKTVWQSLKGFRSYRLEDVDFSWRALKKGYRLRYTPKGLVYHDNPTHFIQKFRRLRAYGKSYSELIYIHKIKLHYQRPSSKHLVDSMRPTILLLSSIVFSWLYFMLYCISPIALYIGFPLLSLIQIYKFLTYKQFPGWKFILMINVMKVSIVFFSFMNALRKKTSV
jgi:GT2 family glycosyltransferase